MCSLQGKNMYHTGFMSLGRVKPYLRPMLFPRHIIDNFCLVCSYVCKLLKCSFLLIFMFICVFLVYGCAPYAYSAHISQKRGQIPWNWRYRWLWGTIWVLRAEPGSSAEAASAFNHWPISWPNNDIYYLLFKTVDCVTALTWKILGVEMSIFPAHSASERTRSVCTSLTRSMEVKPKIKLTKQYTSHCLLFACCVLMEYKDK